MYEFRPHRLPLHLTREQWREIIRWFLLEQNSLNIAVGTDFERKRVLRALTVIKTALTKEVPEIFSGTVEVEKRILEGSGKTNENPYTLKDPNEV